MMAEYSELNLGKLPNVIHANIVEFSHVFRDYVAEYETV